MLRAALTAASVLLLACAGRPTEASDTDAGTSSTGPTPTTSTTVPVPGTTSDTGQADTTGGGSSSETGSFIELPTDDGVTAGGLPNGEQCSSSEECASMFCFDLFGFGLCSECGSDDDCPDGGCALGAGVAYAVCNEGALGDGCQTSEACTAPLVCGSVLAGDSQIPFSYCSECDERTACGDGTTCSPVADAAGLYLGCVEPDSVEIGGLCPVAEPGVGDGTVCIGGSCAVTELFMGGGELGICSECTTDSDCEGDSGTGTTGGTGTGGGSETGGSSGGSTGSGTSTGGDTGGGGMCIPASVGMDGFVPAVCG